MILNTIKLQPIPYQGSKRIIAGRIMDYAPDKIKRLVEPFAGSAAVTLHAAYYRTADKFVINDSYEPLMNLWKNIINEPERVAEQYDLIWRGQLDSPEDYYLKIREEFNDDSDPIKFLFLMMKCVKNAIRFNGDGKFNQSADKRRLGRRPNGMRKQLITTSMLLKKKTKLMCADYERVLDMVTPDDFIYMDPPYQGTSNGRNPRYHQGLDLERFVKNLEKLNKRGVPFILSFDGQLGDQKYGDPLPENLNLCLITVQVGRSAQATLNGKKDITTESLYLSPALEKVVSSIPSLVLAPA